LKSLPIDEARLRELVAAAKKALENAYAPYSGYRVGAALLTGTGRIFTGANVENAAYGESLCAERAAVAGAIAGGERELIALAIAAENGKTAAPCGSCRQVIVEFSPECLVVMAGDDGITIRPARDLLPMAFKLVHDQES